MSLCSTVAVFDKEAKIENRSHHDYACRCYYIDSGMFRGIDRCPCSWCQKWEIIPRRSSAHAFYVDPLNVFQRFSVATPLHGLDFYQPTLLQLKMWTFRQQLVLYMDCGHECRNYYNMLGNVLCYNMTEYDVAACALWYRQLLPTHRSSNYCK